MKAGHRHPLSLSILFNIFFPETTGLTEAKFILELLQDGGMKVYIFGPGHMTKMAAMLIYGKNLKKIKKPLGQLP